LLTALEGDRAGAIFPGLHSKRLQYLLRELGVQNATVHGFRSTFATWAQEHDVPRDLREMALAHADGDRVAAAYARSRLVELRADLMERWARFCSDGGGPEGNVIPLAAAQ
jgi:integrase